jgi:hypothetical protein
MRSVSSRSQVNIDVGKKPTKTFPPKSTPTKHSYEILGSSPKDPLTSHQWESPKELPNPTIILTIPNP